MKSRQALGIKGGMLIGNPVPAAAEIERSEMETAIVQAIQESESAGVTGKAVTPWLLARIVEITNGKSLVTNQALIKNNAALAANIAIAMSRAS